MNKIKTWVMSLAIVMSVGGSLITVATPQTAFAANPSCAGSFLGFPVWYRGLTVSNTDCNIKNPSDDLSGFIWHIALNVVEMALMLVGYVALFFILYGGFQYITSNGSSETVAKSRMMILNAVIGLVISIASVAIVNLISSIMG